MKKKIIKIITIALSVLLIVFCIGEVAIYSNVTHNKDEINKYLDKYDTGTATFEDVRAVNLHMKNYVKIGETETADIVLSRSYWFFGFTLMNGYKKIDRLGSTFVYEDKKGNHYAVTETDDWCRYFRVYSVSKGVID